MEASHMGANNWVMFFTQKYILWVIALHIWNLLDFRSTFSSNNIFQLLHVRFVTSLLAPVCLWWCTNSLQKKRLQNCSGKYTESVRSWTECNAVLHHQHKPGFKTAQSCKLCSRFASRGQNSCHRRKIARTEVGHVGRPECLFPQMLRGASVKAASVKKRHVC